MQMDLDAAHSKAALAKAKRTDDFSQFILKDRLALATRRAQLASGEESVLRLLNVLPRASREANARAFSPLQNKAKEAINDAIETEKATRHDWSQSAALKTHFIKLVLIEIEVAVFADSALNIARRTREAAEHLYRICNRIWYVLFALGLALAIYANLAHIRGLIGGE